MIMESITVDVPCDAVHRISNRCHAVAEVTIVAVTRPEGRQDLVLFPVGWQAIASPDREEANEDTVGALCPAHREVR